MEPAIPPPREGPQDCGLSFVANADKSAPISGAGRGAPGSRGIGAMLLLLLVNAGFVRGPSRVHHPPARSGPLQLTSGSRPVGLRETEK